MTRVCCFGAYDRTYPRNRILRQGLRRAGLDVVEACVAQRRAWLRYPTLLAAWAPVASGCDVLLVPEFRHKDMPLARALHGKRFSVGAVRRRNVAMGAACSHHSGKNTN